MITSTISPHRFTGRLFAVTVLLLTLGCNTGLDPLLHPIGGRSFWARDFTDSSGNTAYQFGTMFRGGSEHAKVYVELDLLPYISDSLVQKMLDLFENKIYKTQKELFTKPIDIDNDGKVYLLVLDIQDPSSVDCDSAKIAGYFDANNEFTDSSIFADQQLRSNEKEIVYLDAPGPDLIRRCTDKSPSSFYKNNYDSDEILSTLAHEYQHLLHFTRDYAHILDGGLQGYEDVWVNEGLSEMASVLAGFKDSQAQRVEFFQFDWSLTDWTNDLRDYSAAYLFFQWLYDNFGTDLLSGVFNNDDIGVEPVGEAINGLIEETGTTAFDYGVSTLSDKRTFDLAYLHWQLNNLNKGQDYFDFKISYDGSGAICDTGCTGYDLATGLFYAVDSGDDDGIADSLPQVDLNTYNVGTSSTISQALLPFEPYVLSQQENIDEPQFDPTCTAGDSANENCVLIYTAGAGLDPAYLIVYHTFTTSETISITNASFTPPAETKLQAAKRLSVVPKRSGTYCPVGSLLVPHNHEVADPEPDLLNDGSF